MGQVGGQAVRNVDGGGGVLADHLGEVQARDGCAVVGDQGIQPLGVERQLPARGAQPQPAVTDMAGDEHPVSRARARARHGPTRRGPSQGGQGEGGRAGRGDGVAAQEMHPELRLVLGQAGGEGLALGPAAALGPLAGQEIAERLRALCGEVRQVHPQQLAGHGVQRVVGQEMHALDNGVLRQDQVEAGAGGQGGDVVAQPSRPFGMSQRRQELVDRLELARDVEGGHQARASRATPSRAALTNRASASSKKALASSTYSSITTSRGVSGCFSSSQAPERSRARRVPPISS